MTREVDPDGQVPRRGRHQHRRRRPEPAACSSTPRRLATRGRLGPRLVRPARSASCSGSSRPARGPDHLRRQGAVGDRRRRGAARPRTGGRSAPAAPVRRRRAASSATLMVGELRNGPGQALEVAGSRAATGRCVARADLRHRQQRLGQRRPGRAHDPCRSRWTTVAADWRLDAGCVAAGPAVPGLAGGPAGRARRRRAGAGCGCRLYLGRLPAGQRGRRTPRSAASRGSPRRPRPTWCRRWSPGHPHHDRGAGAAAGIALTYPASTVAGVSLNGQQVPMRVVDRVTHAPAASARGLAVGPADGAGGVRAAVPARW